MKKLILTLLVSLLVIESAWAESTPYEEARRKIYRKYYCLATYGVSEVQLTLGEAIYVTQIGWKEAVALALAKYQVERSPRQVDIWLDKMEKELKDARKLMGEEDKIKEFYESQYGTLMEAIKTQFHKKYHKGEYESTNDFAARLSSLNKQVYIDICQEMLCKMNTSLSLEIEPIKYDADDQTYETNVTEKFSIGEYNFKNKYQTYLPMEPETAKAFKKYSIASNQITSVIWAVTPENKLFAYEVEYMDSNNKSAKYQSGPAEAEFLTCPFDLLYENPSAFPGYVWDASTFKGYFTEYNAKLQDTLDFYNKFLSEYEYNIHQSKLNSKAYTLSTANAYNIEALNAELQQQALKMENDCNSLKEQIKASLRNDNPETFVKIYSLTNPDINDKITDYARDYKCMELDDVELALFVIDGEKPAKQTCKEAYIKLFNNDDEFEQYYQGEVELFNNEVKKRLQLVVNWTKFLLTINKEESLAFKGCEGGKNPTVLAYAKELEDYKIVDVWYENALRLFFDKDAKMLKEYQNNGQFFDSKGSFFEAYISPDYKKILKSKK